jgi:hypothetical protein
MNGIFAAILVECARLNDREMTSLRTTFIEGSLEAFVAEHTFAIRFVPPVELTIGYHRHAAHVAPVVRSALLKVPNCKIEVLNNALTAKTTDLNKPNLLDAVDLARQRLEQFGAENITAKAVEIILGITALDERWSTTKFRNRILSARCKPNLNPDLLAGDACYLVPKPRLA